MKFSIRKAALSIVALATLGYGFMEFLRPASVTEKRVQLQKLDDENRMLRQENDKLRKRIENLASNPEAQELEIRKRYHMVKPGETAYVLQDKKPVAQ